MNDPGINALLGNRVYIPELKETIRQKNGLWYNHKTLSGVLYFDTLRYDNSKPKLFKNPWAKNPILLVSEEIGIENIDAEIKYVKG